MVKHLNLCIDLCIDSRWNYSTYSMHNCEFDLPLGNATQYSEEFATIFLCGIQSSLSSTDMFYIHSRQNHGILTW